MQKAKTPAAGQTAGVDLEAFGQRPISTPITSGFQLLRGWKVDARLGVELLWNREIQEAFQ